MGLAQETAFWVSCLFFNSGGQEMFADWVEEKERRHNCLVGIKSQNLLLLPRFGVYGGGTPCAMVETAQVWKREYLVSVQSSHLTAGCPWPAHSVLQSLPKRVQQDTG